MRLPPLSEVAKACSADDASVALRDTQAAFQQAETPQAREAVRFIREEGGRCALSRRTSRRTGGQTGGQTGGGLVDIHSFLAFLTQTGSLVALIIGAYFHADPKGTSAALDNLIDTQASALCQGRAGIFRCVMASIVHSCLSREPIIYMSPTNNPALRAIRDMFGQGRADPESLKNLAISAKKDIDAVVAIVKGGGSSHVVRLIFSSTVSIASLVRALLGMYTLLAVSRRVGAAVLRRAGWTVRPGPPVVSVPPDAVPSAPASTANQPVVSPRGCRPPKCVAQEGACVCPNAWVAFCKDARAKARAVGVKLTQTQLSEMYKPFAEKVKSVSAGRCKNDPVLLCDMLAAASSD